MVGWLNARQDFDGRGHIELQQVEQVQARSSPDEGLRRWSDSMDWAPRLIGGSRGTSLSGAFCRSAGDLFSGFYMGVGLQGGEKPRPGRREGIPGRWLALCLEQVLAVDLFDEFSSRSRYFPRR